MIRSAVVTVVELKARCVAGEDAAWTTQRAVTVRGGSDDDNVRTGTAAHALDDLLLGATTAGRATTRRIVRDNMLQDQGIQALRSDEDTQRMNGV